MKKFVVIAGLVVFYFGVRALMRGGEIGDYVYTDWEVPKQESSGVYGTVMTGMVLIVAGLVVHLVLVIRKGMKLQRRLKELTGRDYPAEEQ
jgi:hypothetical protein